MKYIVVCIVCYVLCVNLDCFHTCNGVLQHTDQCNQRKQRRTHTFHLENQSATPWL